MKPSLQSESMPRSSRKLRATSERSAPRGWAMFAWPRRDGRQSELGHGFWVLGDQAVVSLTNFTTTLIIGWKCIPAELGLYGLGFMMLMYLSGIAKAMVWSPYTVFYPKLTSAERGEYTASTTLQLVAIASLIGLGLAIAGVVAQFVVGNASLARLFWVLAPASVLMMTREHVRRLCLAWRDAGEVFRFDLLVSGLQITGLVVLAQTGRLSGTTAYWAAICACTASLGWLVLRRENFSFQTDQWLVHLRKNWGFAKWLFGGAVVVLAEQGLFYWGLSFFHGMAAVGLLAAAQSVILVANPVILGLANYCGPVTAINFTQHGFHAMYRSVVLSSAMVLGFALLFLALVVVGGRTIVEMLYGAEYDGGAVLTITVAMGLLARAMLMPIELGFLAAEQGQFLFTTAVVRLLLALIVGLPLIFTWGAAGVGYAICAGNLVVLAWEWIVLRRLARHA